MKVIKKNILTTPKSLQMVTAAMKLKDACSLEGKLDSILNKPDSMQMQTVY